MFDTDTFDFLISDENEVLLILTARDTPPDIPAVRLKAAEHTIELYRHVGDSFLLRPVDDRVFMLLSGASSLLVCEILPTDNPDETEIKYTYEAEIID